MTDLINASTLRMSTREIAVLCEKEHRNVLRDARDMLAQLEIDPLSFGSIFFDAYQRQQSCLELPKDLILTLVSGYSVVLRKRIIDRWLALEAQTTAALPTTFAHALRLAAEQAERIEAQTRELTAARSAVAFVERHADTTGLQGFRQVCKLLGAKENRFRDFLLEKRIMYRLGTELVPHASHLNAGRFVIKAGVALANEHAYTTAKFTAKGVQWIAGEWGKYQLACSDQAATISVVPVSSPVCHE